MLNIKLNIQRFSSGSSSSGIFSQWSAGITQSGITDILTQFKNEIEDAEEAIKSYDGVDFALQAGWSGQDCDDYLEKFHEHAQDVCDDIDKYKEAVAAEVDKIIAQWEDFQKGLVS